MCKFSQSLIFVKKRIKLFNLILLFTGFLIISCLPLTKADAQTANSLFFSQSAVTLAPKATLILKANVGTNSVNFASAAIQIDITKVKVDPTTSISFPLSINKTLFVAVPATETAYINCNPNVPPYDKRCSNGVIKFALAKCPTSTDITKDPTRTLITSLEGCYHASNISQTGNFDLASIPLVSVNNIAPTTSTLNYFASDTECKNYGCNELVKEAPPAPPTDLTISKYPATLTIPIRGDAKTGSPLVFDGHVTIADFQVWQGNAGGTLTGGAAIGDFDGNGVISIADFQIWQGNAGK